MKKKPKYTTQASMKRGTKPDRYTFDDIWYMDGGVLTCGNNELRALVSRALSRVPKDVVDRVMEDVIIASGNEKFYHS